MKKIYLLAFSVLAVNVAFAQSKQARVPSSAKGVMDPVHSSPIVYQDMDRDIIWTNTFDDINDWDLENGANAPYNLDVNGGVNWQIGDDVQPSGSYAINPISSSTEADGFALIDSDNFGAAGTLENCWMSSVEAINCAAYDHVSVRFETYYRKWTGEGVIDEERCLLEVSTDGVTWPDVETWTEAEAPGMRWEIFQGMAVQASMSNPTLKIFDITSAAANEATVYIRFRWVGSWGYAWMMDDVQLFETPENDLTVEKAWNGDPFGVLCIDGVGQNPYDYYQTPQSQIPNFMLGVSLSNLSYTAQNDATVDFAITGPESASYDLQVSLEPSVGDSLFFESDFSPTANGVYTLTVDVPADDLPEGDTYVGEFEITDWLYGHNTDNDLFNRGYAYDEVDDILEAAVGNLYVMNSNATLGGVDVLFGDLTNPGLIVQAAIRQTTLGVDCDYDFQNNELLGTSEYLEITQDMLDAGEYITLGILDENGDNVQLDAGEGYVLEIYSEFDSEDDALYIAANVGADDGGTIVYGNLGSADPPTNWYFTNSWSPAVRMNLNPAVSVKNASSIGDLEVNQNWPNPAVDQTNITYNLKTASAVQLMVRDMAGKEVYTENFGQKNSGKHTINLHLANFSAGVYSYTLVAGSTQLTKEMIIR